MFVLFDEKKNLTLGCYKAQMIILHSQVPVKYMFSVSNVLKKNFKKYIFLYLN